MERKSSLISATMLMVTLNFIKPALGIFLLPLYLNVLSGTEYGLYTVMVAVSAMVNITGTLRINSAMTTFYFDHNHDEAKLRKYLAQIFSFSILLSVICFTFFLIFGELLFGTFFQDESITFYPYGIIVVASGLLNAINSVFYIFLKNKKRFVKLSRIILFQIILAVIIQVVLILIYKLGVYGLLLGVMVPYALTFLYILFTEKNIIDFSFERKLISPSLKYSIALIPFLLIYWLTTTGDRLILEQYLNLEMIGQYALLMTITGVMFLVADSVMNGIRPFLYEAIQNRNKATDGFVKKLIKFYMASNLLCAGGILFVGHQLHLITDKEIFLNVIPYFTLATTVVFMRSYLLLFNMQLNYSKSSRDISLYSILSLILLLVLFHLWAEEYGLNGVLIASLLTGIFSSITFFIIAQRRMYLQYNLLDVWLIPFASFALFFAVSNFIELANPIKGIIHLIISMIGVLFILKGNFSEIIALLKGKQESIEQ